LIVRILKFEEYNPRKDIKHPRWFAFNNRLLEDPEFYDFSSDEKLAWIYILSQASQKNKDVVEINFRHASRVCSIPEKALKSAISKLNRIGCTEHVRDTYGPRTESVHDTTEQDTTQQTKQTNAHSDEFAEFYSGYPRKIGKADGLKAYIRERKAGATAEDLLLARDTFRKHHEKSGTEPKFIPYPATMLSSWKDWHDPLTGTSDLASAKPLSIADILAEKGGQ
jgi:hypothetical protein